MSSEDRPIAFMIAFYCKSIHKTDPLCPECKDLLNYAQKKVDNCRYGKNKPACSDCKTHCFKKEIREKMRVVMRYSGPRMMYAAPGIAFWHYIKKLHWHVKRILKK